MKTFGLIFIILFLNCSHAVHNQEMSYFEFEMNGENYQILSVNAPDEGDPFNQLIGKDFIALDYKQDQNIDKVMVGDPKKLNEYLNIYKYGIRQAVERGKLKEKKNINSYSNTMNMKFYNIITYIPAVGKPYNEFIYIEAFAVRRVIKAIDRNADGKLNIITSGIYDMEKLQKEYFNFIQNGITRNQIIQTDGMYLVILKE